MGSGRGGLAGDWSSTGGILNITAAAWTAGFQWWRSGDITWTQNVSEYVLVLVLCLVDNCDDYPACWWHQAHNFIYDTKSIRHRWMLLPFSLMSCYIVPIPCLLFSLPIFSSPFPFLFLHPLFLPPSFTLSRYSRSLSSSYLLFYWLNVGVSCKKSTELDCRSPSWVDFIHVAYWFQHFADLKWLTWSILMWSWVIFTDQSDSQTPSYTSVFWEGLCSTVSLEWLLPWKQINNFC